MSGRLAIGGFGYYELGPRLVVGTALIKKDGLDYPTWNTHPSTAPPVVREREQPLERWVSTVIGRMPFLWLAVGDAPGPGSVRGYIEKNAIALLSNCGKQPVDSPSRSWLGHHCDREKVRAAGIWNSNHVEEHYHPAFLDTLAVELAATYRRYNCCIERTIVVGKPSPAHVEQHKVVRAATEAVLDAFVPGDPLGRVDEVHRKVLDEAGFAEQRFAACGYSLGATYRPSWMDVPPMIFTGNERRGVRPDPGAWSGPTWLEQRDVLRDIHEDYIRAGADIIITNTFCTARHQLEPVGYGKLVEETNRAAVAVAKEARDAAVSVDRPVLIAGSVSHAFANSGERFRVVERGTRWDDPAALSESYREQVSLLVESGVDLTALETMQRPETGLLALEAALETELPVWLGLSIGHVRADGTIPCFDQSDVELSDTLDALLDEHLWAVLVMHTEVDDTAAALSLISERWDGHLGAYPHSGFIEFPHWHQEQVIEPLMFADTAQNWYDQGARLIGGCCGVGPAHIAALREKLP